MRAVASVLVIVALLAALASPSLALQRNGEHLKDVLDYHEVVRADHKPGFRSRREPNPKTTITLTTHGRDFVLDLQPDPQVFRYGIKVTVIDDDGHKPFKIDRANYLAGRVQGERRSLAKVYRNPDGSLLGRIHIEGDMLVLEPAHRHYRSAEYQGTTLVYKQSALRRSALEDHFEAAHTCHASLDITQKAAAAAAINDTRGDTHAESRRRRADDLPTGTVSEEFNTCLVTAVSDYRFYADNGANIAAATSVMINHIEAADEIFRATVFEDDDSTYENLGLAVNEVLVYTSASSDPFYSATKWEVTDLLTDFSRPPASERPTGWSSSCLAHLFTHIDFDGGTLGLAWVGNADPSKAGGMCHSSSNQWLNTGLTTNINYGNPVATRMSQLVTTHEFGHNWGSSHDESAQCTPTTNGLYIMYPTAVDGSDPNNDKFSPCSIAEITPVLRSKGDCFSTPPAGICGNGAVEPDGRDGDPNTSDDEECDAGSGGDDCCTDECKLAVSAECSDANNECCENCQAAVGKVCFTGYESDPLCRGNGTCVGSGSDVACEDPLPGKAAGSSCGAGGRCDGSSTLPYADRCISFCERYGATQCNCPDTDDRCNLCCRADPDAACDGSDCNCPFNSTSGCVIAADIITPALGACFEEEDFNVDQDCVDGGGSDCYDIFLPAGSACPNGTCNTEGECEKQNTGIARFWNLFSDITLEDVREWIENNIVGAVMLFTLILWCPCGCLICHYDSKQRRKNADYGTKNAAHGTLRYKHQHRQRTLHHARQPQTRPPAAGVQQRR